MSKQGTKQRPQVFIGGEGLHPEMDRSEIHLTQHFNLYSCRAKVDTPCKRYWLDLILSEDENKLFLQQRGKARIVSICGVTVENGKERTVYRNINGKRVKCKTSDAAFKADETAKPINGEYCAVMLAGVGMLFSRVQVEDLPENTRCAYLDALNAERKDKTEIEPKKPGRKKKYDWKEDAQVYAHWKEQRAINGRLTVRQFHADFYLNMYTLEALEKMLGRARKREDAVKIALS